MGQSTQYRLPHLSQYVTEARVARKVASQYEGVDE